MGARSDKKKKKKVLDAHAPTQERSGDLLELWTLRALIHAGTFRKLADDHEAEYIIADACLSDLGDPGAMAPAAVMASSSDGLQSALPDSHRYFSARTARTLGAVVGARTSTSLLSQAGLLFISGGGQHSCSMTSVAPFHVSDVAIDPRARRL